MRACSSAATVLLAVSLAAAVTGCGADETSTGTPISPQPIPTPGLDVRFDAAKLAVARDGDTASGRFQVRGAKGALSWAPGTVTVFDLTSHVRAEGVVDDDGGFAVTLDGALTDELRLIGDHQGYRAEIDVRGTGEGAASHVGPRDDGCFVVTHGARAMRVARPGATQTLRETLTSECTTRGAVSVAWLSGPTFRAELSAREAAPGDGVALDLVFAPATPGSFVEVLDLDLGGTHLPLTLYGVADP